MPLRPEVDAEWAALMISSTSFRLGSLKLNSVVGGRGWWELCWAAALALSGNRSLCPGGSYSASPLAVGWMMLDTSSSNCSHSLHLMAGGHLIRCCRTTLLGFGGSGMWRDWALWVASWPGSSCVSPGSRPVCCTSLSCSKHFVLAWWIFRPR